MKLLLNTKTLILCKPGWSHNNTSPFDFSATCSEVTCELRPKSDWNKQTSPLLEFHPLKLLSAQNGTGSTDLSHSLWDVSIWTPTREARALTGVGLTKVLAHWLIRLIIKLALDFVLVQCYFNCNICNMQDSIWLSQNWISFLQRFQ